MKKAEKQKKVVVFFGLVASGKSYLAKVWAAAHNFPYCNTDVVRKRLAQEMEMPGSAGEKKMLLYSPAFTEKTYKEVLRFAGQALDDKDIRCVVVDGSFQERKRRQKLISCFTDIFDVYFVLCCCSEEETKVRLAKRALDPSSVSDGDWSIYLQQRENFEPPTELSRHNLLTINTEKAIELLLLQLDRSLGFGSAEGQEKILK